MAHTLKRLEGFELGGILSLNGDVTTGAGITVQSTIKRSGDYALQVLNDGVSAAHERLSISFDATTLYASTTALFAACSYRLYLYIVSYPSANGTIVWALDTKTPGFTPRHVVSMSTTGVLTVDGTAGSTVLALATWYQIDCIYDSASTGSVSLRIDGEVEVTGATPTSNGTVGTLRFGKTANGASYTYVVDDVAIEAAAAVASIDYPPSGNIIAVDVTADGHYDGTWAPTPTAFTNVLRPQDNLTTIAISSTGTRRQSFEVESAAVAGLSSIINGVQICGTSKRDNANAAVCSLIAWATGQATSMELGTGPASPTGTTYNMMGYATLTNPFTLLPWVAADFDIFEIGAYGSPSASGILRFSTIWMMVDSQVEAGATVNTTFLQQAQYPLGLLRSVTNYQPELKTVRLTSESYGVPNEVFNIIACSIRHVPTGVGVIRGSWTFDQNTTGSFTLANNPLRDAVMRETVANSSFILDESSMVDGQQVYTEYVGIQDQGKIFDLTLTQEGSNCMEILAIDFELIPGGRQPAYLEAQF